MTKVINMVVCLLFCIFSLMPAVVEASNSKSGYCVSKYGTPEFVIDDFCFYKNVVVDARSRLMWARNATISEKRLNWIDAIKWATSLDYAGYRDWRVPTKEELVAFVKRGGNRPSDYFSKLGFCCVLPGSFWTATEANDDSAWEVDLLEGEVEYDSKSGAVYVWPVRGE